MGKLIGIILVLIVLVGGGAAIYAARHKSNPESTEYNSSTSNTNKKPTPAPAASPNQSGTAAAGSTGTATASSVTIQNFAFSPANISVKKGTTVTWTNKDSTAHTVTSANGGPLDSGNVDPGKTYSYTFKVAGTFSYHCTIHPQMTGSVVVTD